MTLNANASRSRLVSATDGGTGANEASEADAVGRTPVVGGNESAYPDEPSDSDETDDDDDADVDNDF
jgi:hypothetical protein